MQASDSSPESTSSLQLQRKRGRLKLIIGAVVGLAVLGGGIAAISISLDEHLTATPSADVKPPVLPGSPMTADMLKTDHALTATFFGFKNLFDEPNAGGTLRFVVEDKSLPESPFLCTFTDAKAQCRKLPQAIGAQSGLRLLATADDEAAPLVFAGNRGSEGIFRSDTGALVERLYSYGGHIDKQGNASVLGWDEQSHQVRLLRQAPGQPTRTSVVKPDMTISNYFYSTALLWNQLLGEV